MPKRKPQANHVKIEFIDEIGSKGSLKSYQSFQRTENLISSTFSRGDYLYLYNPTGSDQRIILLTEIQQKKDVPILKGRWISTGQEIIKTRRSSNNMDHLKMDKASNINQRFDPSLIQDEVVFTDSFDNFPIDQMTGNKCNIVSKQDFYSKFPNGFKILKRKNKVVDRVYFCERGVNLQRGNRLAESWESIKTDSLLLPPKSKSLHKPVKLVNESLKTNGELVLPNILLPSFVIGSNISKMVAQDLISLLRMTLLL
jgi:hypothetical protein